MTPRGNRSGQRRRRLNAEMNVVPYIDVMLVLLIIFMVTAPILTQGVTVQLPQAKAESISQVNHEPLIVTVDRQGAIYTNQIPNQLSSPIDLATLASQAQSWLSQTQSQSRQAYVKADQSVPYGQVMQVMSTLQQSGVSNIGLITQTPNEDQHG
jgi:biopolymer transport protein TolR